MSSSTIHVLFICGKNRWRSPAAEQVFAERPGISCASAGLSRDADVALSPEQPVWADLIFVMEKAHKARLSASFRQHLDDKRVICLGIPDNDRFMDPTLVRLLQARVLPYLPGPQ